MSFARITGAVYLLYFVTAIASGLLTPGVTGPGRAPSAATIHTATYQAGVALGLVSTCLYVALIVLLYRLLRPVSSTLALLALVFGLMGCAVMAVGSVLQIAPSPASDSLALTLLGLNARAERVALVFFGTFQLFLGYLILRSGFLPRAVGGLIAVAGAGWLMFLAPTLPAPVAVFDEVLGAGAEGALMLWLLIVGINERRRGRWDAAAGGTS